MYKNKKSGIIGIIVTILLLVIIVFLSNVEIGKLSYAQNVFTSLIMPVQNGLTYLKQKNKELEESLRELEITKNENSRLTELLGLKEKYTSYSTIPAYVINRDMNNYSNMIVIDSGKKDGIEENMVVIADKGLVGHVVSVSDTTAKVQTIVDPSSSVSSTLSTTRDNLVIRGSIEGNGRLKGTFIQPHVTIVSTKNITDRYIWIETAVDFTKLETVLVIK